MQGFVKNGHPDAAHLTDHSATVDLHPSKINLPRVLLLFKDSFPCLFTRLQAKLFRAHFIQVTQLLAPLWRRVPPASFPISYSIKTDVQSISNILLSPPAGLTCLNQAFVRHKRRLSRFILHAVTSCGAFPMDGGYNIVCAPRKEARKASWKRSVSR